MYNKFLPLYMLSFLISSFFLSCSKKTGLLCLFELSKINLRNAKAGTIQLLFYRRIVLYWMAGIRRSGWQVSRNTYGQKFLARLPFYSSIPDSVTAIIKNLTKGVYQVELKVTDNGGLSAKDTLMITVDSVATSNHPPISDAGSDQTISTSPDFLFDGITVLLDGSKSLDPDSNIYSYQWSPISGAPTSPFSNPNAVQTEVNFFEYGSYQFELKVTDSGGCLQRTLLQ